MVVSRKGNELFISLCTKEDALGLYAVMTGNTGICSPEIFQKGQWIYHSFFQSVEVLTNNYEKETEVKYIKNPPRNW